MFEVLTYVYENYWRGDACPEPQQLGRKLSAVMKARQSEAGYIMAQRAAQCHIGDHAAKAWPNAKTMASQFRLDQVHKQACKRQ